MTALPACAAVAVITALVVSQTPLPSLLSVAVAMLLAVALGLLGGGFMFGDGADHPRPGVTRLRLGIATSLVVSVSGLVDLNRWIEGLPSTACEDAVTTVAVVVDGLPETLAGSFGAKHMLKVPVRALAWKNRECSNVKRLNAFVDGALVEHTVWVGDALTLEGRVSRPWGRVNPSSLEGERYALLAGIHGNFRVKGKTVVNAPADLAVARVGALDSLLLRIQRARQEHSLQIRERVGGAAKRFVPALVVGDRRYLTKGDWERLQVFRADASFCRFGSARLTRSRYCLWVECGDGSHCSS